MQAAEAGPTLSLVPGPMEVPAAALPALLLRDKRPADPIAGTEGLPLPPHTCPLSPAVTP